MKKLMAFVFILVMLLGNMTTVFAEVQFTVENEDFSIRGGIHWGSTKEDIQNIETSNGNSSTDSEIYYGEYDLSYLTVLAGYEASITYWMDSNQTLDEFQYVLYQGEAYSNIKAALTQKYGDPLFDEQSYIAGTGIDRVSKKLAIMSPSERDYAGWIVQYNDCYLMLETKHVYFSQGGGMSLYLVNYDVLSYEEMATHQAAYDGLVEYMNSSFENDL